jgi:hypothetical protein
MIKTTIFYSLALGCFSACNVDDKYTYDEYIEIQCVSPMVKSEAYSLSYDTVQTLLGNPSDDYVYLWIEFVDQENAYDHDQLIMKSIADSLFCQLQKECDLTSIEVDSVFINFVYRTKVRYYLTEDGTTLFSDFSEKYLAGFNYSVK